MISTRRSVCSTICVHISAGIFHGTSYFKKKQYQSLKKNSLNVSTGNVSSISKFRVVCGAGIKPSACVTLNLERL